MPKAGVVEVDVEPGMVGFGDKLARGVSQSNISALSKEMTRVGNKMTAFLTAPIAIGFGLAFAEANESIKVGRQTEAVIRSTGGAANITAKEVGNLAGRLSEKVGIDDEAIQSGQNLLLTFKNIRNEAGKGNDIFSQATKLTLDMSVAMGTDMRTAALQAGKALNDPITGMTALRRVGVQFTESQQDQIKALVQSGDLMGAQKIILRELATEFGGSAEAAATPFDKLKVKAQNFAEEIGFRAMPLAEKFIGVLGTMIDVVTGLPDWAQTFVVGGVAVLGATGPLLKFGGALLSVVDRYRQAQLDGMKFNGTIAGVPLAAGLAAGGIVALGVAFDQTLGSAGQARREAEQWKKMLENIGQLSDRELLRTFNNELRNIPVEGMDVVIPKFAAFRGLAEENIGTAERLVGVMDRNGMSTSRYQKILDEVAGGQAQANNDMARGSAVVDQLGAELGETGDQAGYLKTQIDDLLGVHLDAEAAAIKYRDSVDALSSSVFSNGATFDMNTAQGRANRQAALDSTQSALGLAQSMVKQSGDVAGANFVMQAHIAQLSGVLRQSGMTEQQVQAYLRTLGLTPGNITTLFHDNAFDAKAHVDSLRAGIDSIPRNVWVDIAVRAPNNVRPGGGGPKGYEVNFGFGWVAVAEGGIFGPGGVQAFARGGILDKMTSFARGSENHVAQIGRKGGPARLWNEPETGGEAYIPLAPGKRRRSMEILGQVARQFGWAGGGVGIAAANVSPVVVNVNAKVVRSDRELQDLVVDAVLQARRAGVTV